MNMAKTQTAKLRYLNVAPRKVRLIADTLRGLPVKEAEAQLVMRPQRSAGPLLKLIRSAVANAKNNELDTKKLVISSITVDGGPALKRSLPRAQGRATVILKKMSHINLVLTESETVKKERLVVARPEKKKKKETKVARKPKIDKEGKPEKDEREGGQKSAGLRKFFRRKSV